MVKRFPLSLIALLVFFANAAEAKLEFDSKTNKVILVGPYIKYNVLNEPYSLGRYYFATDELRMELESSTGEPLEATEDSMPEDIKVFIQWPRFFMNFGKLKLISSNGRILLEETFETDRLGDDEKYARLELEGEDAALLSALVDPFQICLDQQFEQSRVKLCSDFYVYKFGQIQPRFNGKNKAKALVNRKKAPRNAQISLDPEMKQVRLELKFKSGFYLYIRDKVRHLTRENIIIDPQKRRIGVVSGDGSVRPTRVTLKDRFFSFIKENNYFKTQYASSQDWPEDLEDTEMEFAPFLTGASSQLYGILVRQTPPAFEFAIDEHAPIATYSKTVELRGTKKENEILAARVKNELFIHKDQTKFIWNFPTPKVGAVNQNYISLKNKEKEFYFSKRIFRAHQTAVSGSLAVSTSPTLDLVPGYNFAAEHWFEEIWGKSSWSFQRWGLSANIYETLEGFKPTEDFSEKISVNPTNVDLLFRLSPGVRPVQSSFGLGLRFLNFKLFRSISSDLETRFLGIGAFWHTAPQKLLDDIFNIVPFFRYPKWMEVSLFYYPVILGDETLGFSFSWQMRGKLFFAKRWYMDASFNVNNISFKKSKIAGLSQGVDAFGIATAHGTIGIGYFFN